jgi:hypothetical protein
VSIEYDLEGASVPLVGALHQILIGKGPQVSADWVEASGRFEHV